jgi:predicted  nucleic acid-binding Zn-ribbon protein
VVDLQKQLDDLKLSHQEELDKVKKELAKAKESGAANAKDKLTIEQLGMIVSNYSMKIPQLEGEVDNLKKELSREKARIQVLENQPNAAAN